MYHNYKQAAQLHLDTCDRFPRKRNEFPISKILNSWQRSPNSLNQTKQGRSLPTEKRGKREKKTCSTRKTSFVDGKEPQNFCCRLFHISHCCKNRKWRNLLLLPSLYLAGKKENWSRFLYYFFIISIHNRAEEKKWLSAMKIVRLSRLKTLTLSRQCL